MDSAIIMEYKHKEKKIYINIGMKKRIKYKNMCRIVYWRLNKY